MRDRAPVSRLKDADRVIVALLAQLGNAEPPAGMAERILKMADERATVHSPSRQNSILWPIRWKAGVAFAGLVIFALVASLFKPHREAEIGVLRSPSAAPAGSSSSHRESATTAPHGARQEMHFQLETRGIPGPGSGKRQDWNALSFRETRALSHPAPVAPLTLQEKLLLDLVQDCDQEQLAKLKFDP